MPRVIVFNSQALAALPVKERRAKIKEIQEDSKTLPSEVLKAKHAKYMVGASLRTS